MICHHLFFHTATFRCVTTYDNINPSFVVYITVFQIVRGLASYWLKQHKYYKSSIL